MPAQSTPLGNAATRAWRAAIDLQRPEILRAAQEISRDDTGRLNSRGFER